MIYEEQAKGRISSGRTSSGTNDFVMKTARLERLCVSLRQFATQKIMVITSYFLRLPQCFLPILKQTSIFMSRLFYRLQMLSIGRVVLKLCRLVKRAKITMCTFLTNQELPVIYMISIHKSR